MRRQDPESKTGRMRAFLERDELREVQQVSHGEVRRLARLFDVTEGYAELVCRGYGLSIGRGGRRGPR